jgi:hypothetical protein
MAPAGLSAQLVSGRVVDGNTGAPLVGAAVSIDRDETILEERLVIDGTFRFVVEQPGPYRLTVEAFGYESRSIGVIVLEEGFTGIEIALAPRVVELEGIDVNVNRIVPSLARAGFYERKAAGIGRLFLDSAQVADIPGRQVNNKIRGIPGLTLRGRPPYTIRLDGWCRPLIYVDGVPLGRTGQTMPDPRYWRGVEVHEGTEYIPPRYPPTRIPCGFVLIWTNIM